MHRAPITHIQHHLPTNTIFTSAMDGCVRVWEPEGLAALPVGGVPAGGLGSGAAPIQLAHSDLSLESLDVRKKMIYEIWHKQPRAPEQRVHAIPATVRRPPLTAYRCSLL